MEHFLISSYIPCVNSRQNLLCIQNTFLLLFALLPTVAMCTVFMYQAKNTISSGGGHIEVHLAHYVARAGVLKKWISPFLMDFEFLNLEFRNLCAHSYFGY